MRFFILAAAAFLAVAPAAAQVQSGDSAELLQLAREIHDDVLTLDTHVDTPAGLGTVQADPGRFTENQVDLPKMRVGGLNAAFFIVYVRQGPLDEAGFAAARQAQEAKFTGIDRMLRAYPDQIALARSAGDVLRIHRSGQLAALMGMENAYGLGMSLRDLPLWRSRGVRYVGITHMGHNQFADSSNLRLELDQPESLHGGLSELGRELVQELNRAGILVDVSHAGAETVMQAAELSAAPVIASHSAAMAVNENARNLTDEHLLAIAENGGVVQIVAFDPYLKSPPPEKEAAIAALLADLGVEDAGQVEEAGVAARYRAGLARIEAQYPGAAISDLADHIDHAVSVAGIDHVGIASDFDGGGGIIGWRDASETFNVTLELVRRGYSREEIAKLWGGNLLRALSEAEAFAEPWIGCASCP